MSNTFKENVLERITKNNSAICLIDHQLGLLVGVHDITVAELKHNVLGLAKAAKINSTGRCNPGRLFLNRV
jgi:hypothetical protein